MNKIFVKNVIVNYLRTKIIIKRNNIMNKIIIEKVRFNYY